MEEIKSNGFYSQRFCDERHNEVERRLTIVEKTANGIKSWMIGVLITAIFNLIGIIGLLLRSRG